MVADNEYFLERELGLAHTADLTAVTSEVLIEGIAPQAKAETTASNSGPTLATGEKPDYTQDVLEHRRQ